MTPSPEPFAQHPRLAELISALHFRRYPLFLAGLLFEQPGGPLRRATAVASRDGDLLAYDSGEFFEQAGRVPTSRLLDDDLAKRPEQARVDALADLNQAFFAHEVAGWTKGRRSLNEVGIALLHHWFVPQRPPLAITHAEVLGVVPLEVTDALLDEFRRLADRHERGFMVEQAMELLVSSQQPVVGTPGGSPGRRAAGRRYAGLEERLLGTGSAAARVGVRGSKP